MAILADKSYDYPSKAFKETQFLLRTEGGIQELAFAGTNSVADAIKDASAAMVPRAGIGDIHDGIADYWDLMRDYCLALDKTRPVRITGHSLGGGLGAVAALKMRNAGFQIECVYTFGGMRAGGKAFNNIYRAAGIPTYGIVNGRDPIPFAPPQAIGFGDVPQFRYYLDGGSLVGKRPSLFTWKVVAPILNFHPIGKYIANLAAIA